MNDITNKNTKELETLVAEKREEVRTFRFGTAGSKNRDVRATRKARRHVARILTELQSRKLLGITE